MYAFRPIIGIAGGIGSGKSLVADFFAELGPGLVIRADDQVRASYLDPQIRATLRQWWGDEVATADGAIDRAEVARRIFSDEKERHRLEQLLHPWVQAAGQSRMVQAAADPQLLIFVWDTPLLYETGQFRQCDAMVFVEAGFEQRLSRLARRSGWNAGELNRRENSQWPLDRKREISDYVIDNSASADVARGQVTDVLSRFFARWPQPVQTEGAPPVVAIPA